MRGAQGRVIVGRQAMAPVCQKGGMSDEQHDPPLGARQATAYLDVAGLVAVAAAACSLGLFVLMVLACC